MSKFNTATKAKAAGSGPITTVASPNAFTFEGAAGYTRDAKSELFLLAVTNMVGEETFYESASNRDSRYLKLIHQVAIEDFPWLFRMLVWLRTEGNMRSASLVGAIEAVRARLAWDKARPDSARGLEAGWPEGVSGRKLIGAVCQRADEPGDVIAYWYQNYGKALPKPIKRGVADAAVALYTEKSLLKYDSEKRGIRFGDVVDLTHPKSNVKWKSELLRYTMDRHGRNEVPVELQLIKNRDLLMSAELGYNAKVELLRRGLDLSMAGMTWESVAGWIQGPMSAAVWEAIIPSMGYMALIRNLRNFDEAGVSDAVAQSVIAKITDPGEVVRSRQFPFRFWSSFKAVNSTRWSYALDTALTLSLSNLPALDESLILVDTSGSMRSNMTQRSKVMPLEAAAVFGVSLAAKPGNDRTTLVAFASGSYEKVVPKGSSAMRTMAEFVAESGRIGHGTELAPAIARHFVPTKHKRIIIISDLQIFPYLNGVDERFVQFVPRSIPIYAFNLGGYGVTPMQAEANRVEMGGLTDATFKMIPLIESGRNASWPWET